MTSNDDILDALVAQGRAIDWCLTSSGLQRKLTEPADWPH